MSETRLQQIVNAHRAAAALDTRTFDSLMMLAKYAAAPRDFAGALKAPGMSVISEIKRRSPSAGALNAELDPITMAGIYASGGAAALSVLTDKEFFGGAVADLIDARNSVPLPVLRKDFTVNARDVLDARIMGADAILLIVAALTDEELQWFHNIATELQMAVLVEVHDGAELERALNVDGVRIIGVNQRNLHTFEITDAAQNLRAQIPSDLIAVAESGIVSVDDAQRMADLRYDAILVGSSLLTSEDPESKLRQFASVKPR